MGGRRFFAARFFAAIRDASVPSGEVTVYSVKIVLRAANGRFKAFFCLSRPIPPVRMRFIGMRPRLACMCDAPCACPVRVSPALSRRTRIYIKEAATLPFRNVAAVWALRPVVRLSLSVRSRRCPAGRCCVRGGEGTPTAVLFRCGLHVVGQVRKEVEARQPFDLVDRNHVVRPAVRVLPVLEPGADRHCRRDRAARTLHLQHHLEVVVRYGALLRVLGGRM